MTPREDHGEFVAALTVIPKNELAIVAKTEGDKADKLEKVAERVFVGGFSGACVAVIGGVVAAPFVPVIAPVLAITMVASFFGGAATVLNTKGQKARKRQTEAVGKRAERLRETAKSALEAAIADDTIRVGMYLRIEPQDEIVKRVLVENVGATVNTNGRKILSIKARILDGDGTGIGWLKGSSVVSLEQSVAAFPKVIHEASSEDQRVVGADALATLPVPVSDRMPDKILPRITL